MDINKTMELYTDEGLELDAILNDSDSSLLYKKGTTYTPAQQLKKFRTYLYIYLFFIPLTFLLDFFVTGGI